MDQTSSNSASQKRWYLSIEIQQLHQYSYQSDIKTKWTRLDGIGELSG
jgi:hypothetical protein